MFGLLHPVTLYHRSRRYRALVSTYVDDVYGTLDSLRPGSFLLRNRSDEGPGDRQLTLYALAGLNAEGLIWLRHGRPNHWDRDIDAPFPVEAVESAEAAVHGADVVVTVTSTREPVVERSWLSPGVHVNAVGSSIPTARELDSATIAAAALFVDRRESTVNESGEYLRAVEEEGIGPDHIRAELGELLVGSHEGRRSDEELTVFVSLGLAVEDLAAAEYLDRRARSEGAGSVVQF